MTHSGGTELKRASRYYPTAPRKTAVTNPPLGMKAPKHSRRRFIHWLFSSAKKMFHFSVFTPSLVGVVIGLVLALGTPLSSLSDQGEQEPTDSASSNDLRNSELFVGRSIVVGSFVTGIFACTGRLAAAKHKRDDLRVQIGMNSDLRNSDLVDVEVREVFLRGRNLTGARLSRARMHNADFSAADLTDSRLTGGSFVDSLFRGSVMVGLGGYGAEFKNCIFAGADLTRAILVKADLRKSDLRSVDFTRADLRSADLRKVENINLAIFDRTWYSSKTKWPKGFNPGELDGLLMMQSSMFERADVVIDLSSSNSQSDTQATETAEEVIDLVQQEAAPAEDLIDLDEDVIKPQQVAYRND